MAIYSCNIRSIGRTTHAEGTAGAHLRYIGRERAASEVMATHMPDDPQEARTWMDSHERSARKNARLCDKLRIALPRELNEAQRAQLVQDYVGELTQNRVPWYAALHQTGKDRSNPHAHIVLVDRDIETGRRVLNLSDSTRDRQKKGLPGPSAVEWVRERWEHHANAALERAGHDARIDRRTLEAQGIDREPQIHVGPRAQHIDTHVKRPDSKVVPSPSPRNPDRVIDYPMIDAGRTRRERNAEIIDLNLERAARSEHFETRVLAQFERDQRALDRPVENQVMANERRRTLAERRMRRRYAEDEARIRGERDAEAQFAKAWLKQRYAPDSQTIKARHTEQRAEIERRQSGLFGRFLAAVDFTGRTKAKRQEERQALSQDQQRERTALAQEIRAAREAQLQAVKDRYRHQLVDVDRARKRSVSILKQQQEAERAKDDALLQQRAAEREQANRAVMQQIQDWKRAQAEQKRQRVKGAAAKTVQQQVQPKPTQNPKTKAGQDWQPAVSRQPAPDLIEQRKADFRERLQRQRERQEQQRGRGYERDID